MTDKRYRKAQDATESDAVLDEQISRLYEIFHPYAENIFGIGDGNHESVIIRKNGTNLIKRLCEQLSTDKHQILYLGYSWLLRLIFDENRGRHREVIVRGHHGWGGGSRTEGASITKYSHDVKFWRADIFLYGHDHKLKTNDIEEGRILGENNWKTYTKRMLVCGTYQRTYSGTPEATWAEEKGFNPASIKNPRAFIKPTVDSVEITVQH